MKEDRTFRIREKKISSMVVTKGMYIARLDRPWTDLPLMFQGFVVQEDAEIELLQKYCDHVYVDVDLSPIAISFTKPDYLAEFKIKGRRSDYQVSEEFDVELPEAAPVFQQLCVVAELIRREYRESETFDLRQVEVAVKRAVSSVIRNPDPMLWLLHGRDATRYENLHSVGTCILTATFGRFLGLPESMIISASVGALLADLGKASLPSRLLRKTEKLTPGEFALVKEHVYMSLDALLRLDNVSRHTLDAVSGHHERIDGGGYPQGLRGADISPYARVLAIADSYDAMTSERPYAASMLAPNALQDLFKCADQRFERAMIEQFVQCMSTFPTGSIVELSSGEVGLVCAQNGKHRLRPSIKLIRDANKKLCRSAVTLDLAHTERDPKTGAPLFIKRTHPAGAFEIGPEIYRP